MYDDIGDGSDHGAGDGTDDNYVAATDDINRTCAQMSHII